MTLWKQNNKLIVNSSRNKVLNCDSCPCGCLCNRMCPGQNKPTGTITVNIPEGEIHAPTPEELDELDFDEGICISDCWNQDGLTGDFILTLTGEGEPCNFPVAPGDISFNGLLRRDEDVPLHPIWTCSDLLTPCYTLPEAGGGQLTEYTPYVHNNYKACGCWKYFDPGWYGSPSNPCWGPHVDPEFPTAHAVYMILHIISKCPQPSPPDIPEFLFWLRIKIHMFFPHIDNLWWVNVGAIFDYHSDYIASENFCHENGYALSYCDSCNISETGNACPYYRTNQGNVTLFF